MVVTLNWAYHGQVLPNAGGTKQSPGLAFHAGKFWVAWVDIYNSSVQLATWDPNKQDQGRQYSFFGAAIYDGSSIVKLYETEDVLGFSFHNTYPVHEYHPNSCLSLNGFDQIINNSAANVSLCEFNGQLHLMTLTNHFLGDDHPISYIFNDERSVFDVSYDAPMGVDNLHGALAVFDNQLFFATDGVTRCSIWTKDKGWGPYVALGKYPTSNQPAFIAIGSSLALLSAPEQLVYAQDYKGGESWGTTYEMTGDRCDGGLSTVGSADASGLSFAALRGIGDHAVWLCQHDQDGWHYGSAVVGTAPAGDKFTMYTQNVPAIARYNNTLHLVYTASNGSNMLLWCSAEIPAASSDKPAEGHNDKHTKE